MAAIEFTRWFLALFFSGVAIFYTIRILQTKHRRRSSPVFLGHPGTLHFMTHMTFRVFRAIILCVCLARLVWPSLDRYLVVIAGLWHPIVLLVGDGLMLIAFAAIIFIHFQMGDDWRSGTRDGDQTRLITTGPFALSRNPMMLCVLSAQLGLFLALPSVFTLVCLVMGVWAVVAQVGVEERLLRKRFGAEYQAYEARTPKWILR
jgi:protein-S-isoprenylcysteine O-methyltransferase Ste14